MSVEGSHTIVVGNWLVDVNVTHYHPGNPPDMRYDSTDPGTEPELYYDVLSAAAVGRDKGGDLNYLNEESVTQAIWEMVA